MIYEGIPIQARGIIGAERVCVSSLGLLERIVKMVVKKHSPSPPLWTSIVIIDISGRRLLSPLPSNAT